ncbi:MAG: hypothetical protein HY930_01935, partial [Euryarchaeota archaeon]|nr:hypothetical protein [Euryarchaeota archaeon]
MKLTSKVAIAFLAVLVPIALVGYSSYHVSKKSLENQVLEDLTLVAEAYEDHVHHFL